MTGTFENFELAFGSFGQQYTTIDGQKYITWFDLADPNLNGLRPGVQVEFEPAPGPTAFCHSPHVSEDLPSAQLVKLVPGRLMAESRKCEEQAVMKANEVVKYSKPVDEEEAKLRFILLRDPEKGRADIQLICDYRIKPIETVEVGEIEVAAVG